MQESGNDLRGGKDSSHSCAKLDEKPPERVPVTGNDDLEGGKLVLEEDASHPVASSRVPGKLFD